MNKQQLAEAMKIAQDPKVRFIDDDGNHMEDISIFDGFGLTDFQTVYCTIPQVAFLIRWQCMMFNGTIDGQALNEIVTVGRHKFSII